MQNHLGQVKVTKRFHLFQNLTYGGEEISKELVIFTELFTERRREAKV